MQDNYYDLTYITPNCSTFHYIDNEIIAKSAKIYFKIRAILYKQRNRPCRNASTF